MHFNLVVIKIGLVSHHLLNLTFMRKEKPKKRIKMSDLAIISIIMISKSFFLNVK